MKTSLITLSFALVCALAIHTMPPETVATAEAVPTSFDIAMPTPMEAVDQAPVRLAAKT